MSIQNNSKNKFKVLEDYCGLLKDDILLLESYEKNNNFYIIQKVIVGEKRFEGCTIPKSFVKEINDKIYTLGEMIDYIFENPESEFKPIGYESSYTLKLEYDLLIWKNKKVFMVSKVYKELKWELIKEKSEPKYKITKLDNYNEIIEIIKKGDKMLYCDGYLYTNIKSSDKELSLIENHFKEKQLSFNTVNTYALDIRNIEIFELTEYDWYLIEKM